MKKYFSCVLFSCFVCVILVGCSPSASSDIKPPAEETGEHGHAHGPDGHSHAGDGKGRDHSVAGHAHGTGPHGGAVADWGGGKYHVEFTVDHDQQQAIVYILGADEKTPTPIAAESVELSLREPAVQVMLEPMPQDDDPAGKVSRFVGNHESLGVVQEFAGTLTAVIEGTPYSGDFEE